MANRSFRQLSLAIMLALASLNGWSRSDQDSLWRVWSNTSLPDTTRLKALGKFAWEGYLFSQPDSAYYYGQMMYDHAKAKGLKDQMAWALRGQGVSLAVKGERAEALDRWLQSMELSRSVNDLVGEAGSLNNIGMLYSEMGDHPKALEYHQRSQQLRLRSGDLKGAAASLNSMAELHEANGDHAKALALAQQAFAEFGALKFEHGQGYSMLITGKVHKNMGAHDKALEAMAQALALFERSDDRMQLAEMSILIGTTHLAAGDPQRALERCAPGLKVAEELGNATMQGKACDCLYLTHKALGHREEALRYIERARALNDDLERQEVMKRLQRMEFNKQMRADSVEKAREEHRREVVHRAEMAQEKARRNILLFSGIGVLVAAGGLWSRLRYMRRSRAAIQKEKNVSEDLLLNILPYEVAEELKLKGVADARLIDEATVLFTDFKGFTAYSEKLTPQELVHDLNECFTAFDNIVVRHGMEKIKTIGDAYMAAGGLPVPNNTHAIDTVRAALEINAFIAEGKARRIARGLPYFEIRIGVHTGPVVAGIVGLRKFSYDIWGDTVNIASRMETSAEVGQVNISESTYAIVKDTPGLVFTPRGYVETKGKGPLAMYYVAPAAAPT